MPPPPPSITESSILTSYLLPPASLRTILPPSNFNKLLPPPSRTNPTLKPLYTALQLQRNIDIDTVRMNIERECQRSAVQKARLARNVREELGMGLDRKRKRKRDREGAEDGEGEREREDEDEPFSSSSADADADVDSTEPTNPNSQPYDALTAPTEPLLDTAHSLSAPLLASTNMRYHTLPSLFSAMSSGISDLEREIAELDAQAEEVLRAMGETVGGLSDLRYGKLARVSEEGGLGVEERVAKGLERLRRVVERRSGGG